MPSPNVVLTLSINGGAANPGVATVSPGATCRLRLQSTAGLVSIRFEIYSYPPSFSLPAGWTNDTTGAVTGTPNAYYYSTDFTPPDVTLTPWGKFLMRAKGNENTTGAATIGLTSDAAGTRSLSPVNALDDLAFEEDSRFNDQAYTAAMKANLRTIENSLPAGGAGTIHVQIFTANGNWTAPAGVTNAFIYGGGGGGGGGGAAGGSNGVLHPAYRSAGGAGGGASHFSMVPVAVTPLTVYAVVVGAGGTGGSSGAGSSGTPNNGGVATDGSASSFGATLAIFPGARKGSFGFASTTTPAIPAGGSSSTNIVSDGIRLPGFGGNGDNSTLGNGADGQGNYDNNRAGGPGGNTVATNGAGGGGGTSNLRGLTTSGGTGGDAGIDANFPASNGSNGAAPSANTGNGGAGGGAGGLATSGAGPGGAGGIGSNGASGLVVVLWVA